MRLAYNRVLAKAEVTTEDCDEASATYPGKAKGMSE